MTIGEFQKLIAEIYFVKDHRRGVEGTFRWFVEEVGELARALRHNRQEEKEEEFADVFAWLVSLASISGVELEQACRKYSKGCPKCHAIPCRCAEDSGAKERE
ncbi:MAG: nucleotide pyrophosphohydrolase [candidate division WOR-3 bacterium]|nr:nucleotide pyrophosphohydrolase [candidate division WOR-3 bacterium]MCR4423028.1 nucleotide pyrophosphohydrolase [candidate division WOR-3 bacterium]MDH7518367.1 MazG nucleotide pyrophosphohydrolase domain-containing protein [bacterium]